MGFLALAGLSDKNHLSLKNQMFVFAPFVPEPRDFFWSGQCPGLFLFVCVGCFPMAGGWREQLARAWWAGEMSATAN